MKLRIVLLMIAILLHAIVLDTRQADAQSPQVLMKLGQRSGRGQRDCCRVALQHPGVDNLIGRGAALRGNLP